ncbi:hypothetical protein HD553DRAFT_313074 [Filobasidium floriforme]|uniref:uncharacterized protein n=1 Tax=Filobasidium floriforme TaxID=5210 RepID=UPI001E8D42AE|nr:uncharacterized protein HD553DRAFT_313074 [Filobasidium floriforme]KAH8083001.1 hypothetical protein HD553DRAFT_313074 [Filobasidium floriforme]
MTEELPASKLGTKEHWDMVYERETKEYEETGDEGEIWFGEGAVDKMVDWTYQYLPPFEDGSGPTVMECGCGNGTLLLSILYPTKPKYRRSVPRHSPRHFTGIDYSDLSIELSSKVEGLRRRRWERRIRSDEKRKEVGEELGVDSDSEEESDVDVDDDETDEQGDAETLSHAKNQIANNPPGVTWFASDLLTSTLQTLHSQSSSVPLDGWDLVLDKGTYDAIALSQEPVGSGPESSRGKLPSAVYPERVAGLVKPGGFFLITSCNFTEDEIKTRFTREGLAFEYHSTVKHPSFSFGGKTGSTVCTVAFRRV